MKAERITAELDNIYKKIQRNRSKGYSTENLEKSFNRKLEEAEKKKIYVKPYRYGGVTA